jgi:hypothetical protein
VWRGGRRLRTAAHASPDQLDRGKRMLSLKRHIASDLDTGLILACAVTPANRPEEEAAPVLRDDVARLPKRNRIGSLHIDRGYVASDLVTEVTKRRGLVLCKPWVARNGKLFSKSDFEINMRRKSNRCPAGEVEYFEPGTVVEFALHDGLAPCRPNRQHRRGRAATTSPPETHRDPQRPASPP